MLTINLKTSRLYLITIAFFLGGFKVFGQNKCAFHHHSSKAEEEKISNHLARRKKNEVIYQIPVVVHIVHDNNLNNIGGSGNSNISDEQILSQIEVLNEDFRRLNPDTINTPAIFKSIAADTKISFCLASFDPDGQATDGITRHYSNSLPFDANNSLQNRRLKAYGYWPADQYLNIWVTELQDDVLGYATFPSDLDIDGLDNSPSDIFTDGIVIDHRTFGNNTGTSFGGNYNNGRTTTHEVGHWLGLYHIWGDEDDCISPDYCDDTPSQQFASEGCPSEKSSCTQRDMFENYMDYSYDACMNIFTEDQKNRMRTVIELSPRRNSLLSSLGCCQVSTNDNFPLYLNAQTNEIDDWIFSDNTIIETDLILFKETIDTSFIVSPFLNFSLLNSPKITIQTSSNTSGFLYYQLPCDTNWILFDTFASRSDGIISIDLQQISNLYAVSLRFNFNKQEIKLSDLSIHENYTNANTLIYPNPSNGDFYISFNYEGSSSKSIEIYDQLGNICFRDNFINSSKINSIEKVHLDLASGVYIVVAHIDGQNFIDRITVTR